MAQAGRRVREHARAVLQEPLRKMVTTDIRMPIVGLGCWKADKGVTEEAVYNAIKAAVHVQLRLMDDDT